MFGTLVGQHRPRIPTSNSSLTQDEIPLDRIPLQILESFFPGFGIASRFFAAFFGVDLAALLYSCFLIVALAAGARWTWQRLLILKGEWFTSSITITSNDKLFVEVMDYLSKMVMDKSRTRYLAAISKNSSWTGYGYSRYNSDSDDSDDEEGEDEGSDADSRDAAPTYGPALGDHWFWHNGCYFGFQREIEGERQGIVLKSSKENITITCLGRSPEPIKKLLHECKTLTKQEHQNKAKICSSSGSFWGRTYLRNPRPLDTIYMDHMVKNELLKDLKRFLSPVRARYYRHRGIPYRRGYLLHGPPGTGKTSLVSALAGYLRLELHVLNLCQQHMDEDDLVNLFQELPRRSIVLIEDIDTIGLKRRILPRDFEDDQDDETKKNNEAGQEATGDQNRVAAGGPSKKFSLSGLLNVIDGVASQEGRILIVTSNNPEALDPALVRPGRIDKQIHLGYLSTVCAKEMFIRMYEELSVHSISEKGSKQPSRNSSSTSLSWDMAADAELDKLGTAFADRLPDNRLSPAEVQGYLLSHEEEPQNAIDGVAAWAEDVTTAREKGKNIVNKDKV